jgi:hypothetical protein
MREPRPALVPAWVDRDGDPFIMPQAYGDRRKLTPAIRRQYLAPFPAPTTASTCCGRWRGRSSVEGYYPRL